MLLLLFHRSMVLIFYPHSFVRNPSLACLSTRPCLFPVVGRCKNKLSYHVTDALTTLLVVSLVWMSRLLYLAPPSPSALSSSSSPFPFFWYFLFCVCVYLYFLLLGSVRILPIIIIYDLCFSIVLFFFI